MRAVVPEKRSSGCVVSANHDFRVSEVLPRAADDVHRVIIQRDGVGERSKPRKHGRLILPRHDAGEHIEGADQQAPAGRTGGDDPLSLDLESRNRPGAGVRSSHKTAPLRASNAAR